MHNLYNEVLCFAICYMQSWCGCLKVFLCSKLLLAKLCLLVFGALAVKLEYEAALFVTSVCRWLTVRGLVATA